MANFNPKTGKYVLVVGDKIYVNKHEEPFENLEEAKFYESFFKDDNIEDNNDNVRIVELEFIFLP